MRLSRLYFAGDVAVGAVLRLERPQSHYLRNVLRLKPGAAFSIFNGRKAIDYRATLIVEGKKSYARIDSSSPLETESALDSEIIQGLGRADHMDWMIQKTTELGVVRIAIFNAERTQSPLKSAQAAKKLAHWNGVAASACEQCGRGIIPQIDFHAGLGQALAVNRESLKMLFDFAGDSIATTIPDLVSSVSMLIGPEGGLGEAEIDLARNSGYHPVSLGPRVLRTETAATAALAILQARLGDFR